MPCYKIKLWSKDDFETKKIQITVKQVNKLIPALLLVVVGLSSIYASDYDFSKLVTLASERYGPEARQDVVELNQLIQKLRSASELEKLKQVNDFFNHKISFTDDFPLWGQSDYWATPLESLGRQAGDCEDFSIAKYVFLKVLNVDNNRLRLTYVRAEIIHDGIRSLQAHMVLSYYETPQSEPLILDNLISEILPASSRKDLSPIFSFNDKGLWVGSSSKPKGEAQSNLSRWRDVLSRIRADGIK
ncbi:MULTISPECIES: transglutaminase-like cysteine peptidase [Methylotenera]|uniref:transglutaminase-like cysteine peptidase n=1 Tax=Methylotenera TaxID=359407 RepID=UPI000360E87A|nr:MULTISPECIES: transglutaminase-like cysteine peptidase [Methylotenera]